jgi:hypothetical protein
VVFVVLTLSIINYQLSILTGCANQVAPQGGPRDSLPPVVKAITPGNEQRLFPTIGGRVFIEFDEYVQLKDASKEFFTSPLMKIKPVTSIRGRGVRIEIKDTLRENQTYSLNFGNAIQDNNEGNPLTGFRYVFSTGMAIDSLLATGYAADAMKGDSVSMAYVYFIDAALDTIPEYDSLLFKHQPLQIGRAQNNGIFIAQNLRDMPYKVYALADNNNNNRYDVGIDKVGFMDSLVNPADLETMVTTSIWFDEYRRYPTADPQLYFRLFSEEAARRQNLGGTERPGRHQAILRFSAPFPQIDTLSFAGIPDERVIREYMTPGRDTISLWFDMAPEALPDTIRGRISYLKPDSLGNIVPASQELRLAWRLIESRDEEREREREERERERAEERGEEYTPPAKPNPFRFKVDAGTEINPQKSIPIEFGLPLSSLDSARIVLETVPDLGDPAPVPFRVVRDTMNIRRWVISADWDETLAYRLVIPEGVFVNVAGERNDSLGANFKIQQRASLGAITMQVRGKTPESKYIVQLVDESGKRIIDELKDVTSGEWGFYYIPEGEVYIRISEDINGNGRWDTGSLVLRRQPERTEFYAESSGNRAIQAAANRESAITLDMEAIFAPISIEKVRDELRRAEDARVAKYLEEKAIRDEERRRQGTQDPNAAGGLGIGSALGGARQQIGTVAR